MEFDTEQLAKTFGDLLGINTNITFGIFPFLFTLKLIFILGMLLKENVMFELETLLNLPQEIFATKIQKSYIKSVSGGNSNVYSSPGGKGVVQSVYEGNSITFPHIQECLDCPELDYETDTNFYSQNPFVTESTIVSTKFPTNAYSTRLDELLETYTNAYDDQTSNLIQRDIYGRSQNQNYHSDYNSVPNKYHIPDNYVVTNPDLGREEYERRLIMKVPGHQPPSSSGPSVLAQGPPITFQTLLQSRMTKNQYKYLQELQSVEENNFSFPNNRRIDEDIVPRSRVRDGIITADSLVEESHDIRRQTVLNRQRYPVVSDRFNGGSQREDPNQGTWVGSSTWPKKAYDHLQTSS